MNLRTTCSSQNDDLLTEIHEAQAVLRTAWRTYPEIPELTGVLCLLRTKLEQIEKAAHLGQPHLPAIGHRKRGDE